MKQPAADIQAGAINEQSKLDHRSTYLEAVAGHGPGLVELAAEAVEADDEGLGAAPHEEHEEEGQRPEREQEEVVGERPGAQRPQRERHVHRRHDVHHVHQEHEPRRAQRAAARGAVVRRALQRPRALVQRPAQPVQRRHEQAEVAAPLAVVEAQVPAAGATDRIRVDEIINYC